MNPNNNELDSSYDDIFSEDKVNKNELFEVYQNDFRLIKDLIRSKITEFDTYNIIINVKEAADIITIDYSCEYIYYTEEGKSDTEFRLNNLLEECISEMVESMADFKTKFFMKMAAITQPIIN